ncbi:hypothetical protein E2C01_084606 [Portunus trituberculatus]|uniref:Uncharacterized protein n=1 Tax=Portunus trituberculatus TaxID=210409 RepID=A0A5B7J0G5_PORTR|nr:hypothetical protein [Portunus trituberculatus]
MEKWRVWGQHILEPAGKSVTIHAQTSTAEDSATSRHSSRPPRRPESHSAAHIPRKAARQPFQPCSHFGNQH